MSPAARLSLSAAGLVVLFAAGAVAGGVVDPDAPAGGGSAAHGGDEPAHGGDAPAPVRGLGVGEAGLRLVVDRTRAPRGRASVLAFRIVDAAGAAVRDFDVSHQRRMHAIVVRRDLTGFRHLHPVMDAAGRWSAPLRLGDAGTYRVFADFSSGGTVRTLAGDLQVDGPVATAPLPAAATIATSDGGHRVRVDGSAARAGEPAELRFTVTKDRRPVQTEPYLGAGGHLVVLREGDLAFLHVHPVEAAEGHDEPGPVGAVGFEATFPTAGRYRMFLQFQVAGVVETVAFTREVH